LNSQLQEVEVVVAEEEEAVGQDRVVPEATGEVAAAVVTGAVDKQMNSSIICDKGALLFHFLVHPSRNLHLHKSGYCQMIN
jgi:hypothetical protein